MKTKLFLILLIVCFVGCKSPKSITTDRTVNIDSLSTSHISVATTDSLFQRIISHLEIEFEYTLIKYSAPDSTGTQHITEQHTLKGTGKKEHETSTSIKSEANIQRTDTTKVNTNIKEQSETTYQKTFWEKWQDAIFNILGLSAFCVILYWIIRTKKI
jgi:hypothetical protein